MRWPKAALVHTLADAVQHLSAERATCIEAQKVGCGLASQRDADPLLRLLYLYLFQALGIPIRKLRLVHNFRLGQDGHVKHGFLVVAPGVGGQLEAAGAVLHQLQGAVEHGLAELLRVHHAVAPCAMALLRV